MEHANKDGRIVLSGCLITNDKKEVLLLFRKDHNHYETPGGKVRLKKCEKPGIVTNEDLEKTAKRELHEELGGNIKVGKLQYFGEIEFIIPDGRLAIAHKFITRIISGKPRICEPELFSKLDYLPISHLENYPISPDLKRLLPELKAYAKGL